MTSSSKNIPTLLAEWGESYRSLPINNDLLKESIMAKLPLAVPRPSAQRKSVSWLSFGFAGAAVVVLLVVTFGQGSHGDTVLSRQSTSMPLIQKQAADSFSGSPSSAPAIPEKGYDLSNQVPTTDTREFTKTDYSAEVRSRHVPERAQQITSLIRGLNGRVDSENTSQSSGFISFAIPADMLSAFSIQVKSLAGARFYTESTMAQNLLSEKRSIEEQQAETQVALNKLRADRESTVASHDQTIHNLQSQLSQNNAQQRVLQSQINEHPEEESSLQPQLQALRQEQRNLNNRIAAENANHSAHLASIDSQIQNTQAVLEALGKQDKQLLDTVATVQGTITISKINMLQYLNAFIPLGYTLVLLLGVGALVSYWHYRRRHSLIHF